MVFVESYGRVAVEDSWFAPRSTSTLSRSDADLAALGYHSRSGWLGSPTFGGLSWLAHSTLQSGLWIDSQQRYDQVLASNRLTLASRLQEGRLAHRGRHPVRRRVRGPRGSAFYRYDRLYGSYDVGYAGPHFSYAKVPDQFTFRAFDNRELADPPAAGDGRDRPRLQPRPWIPLPHIVPWDTLGDGLTYAGQQKKGRSYINNFGDTHAQQQNYADSIRYSLRSLVSFVRHAHDKKLVMVVLGDHQPHSVISGNGASHDVPISLVAHDPAVLHQISGWGWTPGLQPATATPVVPMNEFRDRFLSAFGSRPTGP